ncbi:MAG: hypothetical protein Q8Q09_22180 [Deltaproteobacteria bacterium]|nr:hypothetical protein [Deltaproteobacteria bacterium]
MATGSIPLPMGSVVVLGEGATMITHIAAPYRRCELTPTSVLQALGAVAMINMIGRQVFVEGARLLLALAGPYGLPLSCGFGAITAGWQTWILGHVTIAIAQSQEATSRDEIRATVASAKVNFRPVVEGFERGERSENE